MSYAPKDFYCDEVLSGKIQVEKIWETGRVLAFHHTHPFWEAHVVIIPKQHIESVKDFPPDADLAADLFTAMQIVSTRLEEAYGGCRVSSNVGDYQTTRHLHFYVHAGQRIREEDGSPLSTTVAER